MTPLPPTSVIIPSRGRPELLLGTVRSVLAGDTEPAELIVVDQSDRPHDELPVLRANRGCVVRYLWRPQPGASRARNIGIETAQHEVLVFTDDDVLVEHTWLQSLVGALCAAGPRAVVTGRVLPGPPQATTGFAPSLMLDETPAVYQGRIGRDVLYSANMALYRSAFDEVGLFDARLGPGAPFRTAEDNDLGFRLLEAGYRILYVPEAAIQHLAWRTSADYLPLRWSYGHGQGAFLAKHARVRDPYMLRRLVRNFGDRARAFAEAAAHGRFAADHAAYLAGFASGAAKWLVTQRLFRRRPPSLVL